jgi:BirA family biotin operon repressor/biotin-[acetyl-CoA-carboxylase] ligase
MDYKFQEISLGIEKGVGCRILYFPIIDSTNTFLKQHSAEFSEGIVVWAEAQTAGRGRYQRRWESPPGRGLYFSSLLKPLFSSKYIPLLSLMACLAVKKAIENCANAMGLEAQFIDIKWPNDLYIERKKIAGILLESINQENRADIILGIGLNIKTDAFFSDPGLQLNAGTLEESYGGNWGFARLLSESLRQINAYYTTFNPEKIITEYRQECRMLGKKCLVRNGDWVSEGICRDVGDMGELIIENNVGTHKIISGSVDIEW